MSCDWIKVCKDTLAKPEMRRIAKMLHITRHEAFGWWFQLYAWADSHTADGKIADSTLADIADLSGVPEALLHVLASDSVRWIFVHDGTQDNPEHSVTFV